MAEKDWRKEKFKSTFPGVYFRKHPTRKHGVQADKYFFIRYKLFGKELEEGVGWASAGHTALEASDLLSELKRNRKAGKGPLTLRERRDIADAERQAEAIERKAKASAAKTLQEYWNETYFPTSKTKKKECSWRKEETHFKLWINPLMGNMPVKDIGLSQWDELIQSLQAAGKSKRTQLYVTSTLRLILKHAHDRSLINEAPPSGKRVGVSSPGNNRRTRVISTDEETAIMDELEFHDIHAWRITRFAFLTGCRVAEAFNLVWANVDFGQGCVIFPDTKNDDTRILPLTPLLRGLFASMNEGAPNERVFTKKDGSPYSQAPSAFETTVDRLGLNQGRSKRDRIVFHSIRHTVATRLAATGLGIRELMDIMGWRIVQMAMRYVHSNEDRKAKALASLGATPAKGKVVPFHGARTK